MGWTFSTYFDSNRRAVLDQEFQYETPTASTRVIKSAMVGSTYYAAVENMNKQTGERKVFALIALTRAGRDGGWGYKDMDETMGPYETRCPASILDLLSPTDNQYALEWRQRCRDYIARKKAAPKPVAGMIVTVGQHQYRLDSPVRNARLGWHVTRVSDGRWFRMPARQLNAALRA
jgi:hypothetical protein